MACVFKFWIQATCSAAIALGSIVGAYAWLLGGASESRRPTYLPLTLLLAALGAYVFRISMSHQKRERRLIFRIFTATLISGAFVGVTLLLALAVLLNTFGA